VGWTLKQKLTKNLICHRSLDPALERVSMMNDACLPGFWVWKWCDIRLGESCFGRLRKFCQGLENSSKVREVVQHGRLELRDKSCIRHFTVFFNCAKLMMSTLCTHLWFCAINATYFGSLGTESVLRRYS